jgi:hypothetical protein
MSMTPADPAPPASTPVTTAWTTAREEPLECPGCGAAFVLSYKYRFVDGLSASLVRCPAPGCGQGREYFLPVNSFDVFVVAAQAGAPPPRG